MNGAQASAVIEGLDAKLMAAGNDAAKLAALMKEREAAEREQEELYEEWGRLEEVVRAGGGA